jgi:hypothetical protein
VEHHLDAAERGGERVRVGQLRELHVRTRLHQTHPTLARTPARSHHRPHVVAELAQPQAQCAPDEPVAARDRC